MGLWSQQVPGNVVEWNLLAVVWTVNRHFFGVAVLLKLLLDPVVETVVANFCLTFA